MYRSYKVEIKPTEQQKIKIEKTLGTCRYVRNMYVRMNEERYNQNRRYITAGYFFRWLNHDFLLKNPEYQWIKDVSTKAVEHCVLNAETEIRKCYDNLRCFPRQKKKMKSYTKMYFTRSSSKTFIQFDEEKIKIPTLKWVSFKEKDYIPSDTKIISGYISKVADRYYVSVLARREKCKLDIAQSEGIGIDLGIKEFAVLSNGMIFENINKCDTMKHLERSIAKEYRGLARKYRIARHRAKHNETITYKNINKQQLRIQKLYMRQSNIRMDYLNKCIQKIVQLNPEYIAIEDLDVSELMKRRGGNNLIAVQRFFDFRKKLQDKCEEYGIELRIVNQWYPSSKMCHSCGIINHNLKVCDRVFKCECGYEADRDYNASLNIRDAEDYKVV